jgi:hypothetical protein
MGVRDGVVRRRVGAARGRRDPVWRGVAQLDRLAVLARLGAGASSGRTGRPVVGAGNGRTGRLGVGASSRRTGRLGGSTAADGDRGLLTAACAHSATPSGRWGGGTGGVPVPLLAVGVRGSGEGRRLGGQDA